MKAAPGLKPPCMILLASFLSLGLAVFDCTADVSLGRAGVRPAMHVCAQQTPPPVNSRTMPELHAISRAPKKHPLQQWL